MTVETLPGAPGPNAPSKIEQRCKAAEGEPFLCKSLTREVPHRAGRCPEIHASFIHRYRSHCKAAGGQD